MRAYFGGEKGAGPLLFGAGLAGMAGGTAMAPRGDDITRGAGFPLIGIGLVQGIVGAALLLRSKAHSLRLRAHFDGLGAQRTGVRFRAEPLNP